MTGRPDPDKARAIEAARGLYAGAQPAAGTMVDDYLERGRGIPLDLVWGIDRTGAIWERVPPVLRFVPALWHAETETRWPAMLAPLQNGLDRVCGVHITYLAADGGGPGIPTKAPVAPAKRMRGAVGGCAIRLCALLDPWADRIGGVAVSMAVRAMMGTSLGLAEGIETALSVMALLPTPVPPIWVGASLGNIAGGGLGKGHRHPTEPGRLVPSSVPDMHRPGLLPPSRVRDITLYEDADGDALTTRALQDRAAHRFHAMGLRVRRVRAPEGGDFNDALRARLKSEIGSRKPEIRKQQEVAA